jgi:lipid-A-disaccharide synthase
MNVFISAGEASGDALGAALLEALKRKKPQLSSFGMGGPRMLAHGFKAIRNSNELGVVGLIEVLRHLPRLFRLRDDLAEQAIAARPDIAILIDVPDFNIRLAKKLQAENIPVVFYVGPSVWAWRPGRAARYAKYIDKLLVLFPFELPVWQKHTIDVTCVGHPLIDEIPRPIIGKDAGEKTIALLPGSRRSEIVRHFGTLLESAARLKTAGLADRFVVPVAPTIDRDVLQHEINAVDLGDHVELVVSPDGDPEPKRLALAEASLALVASGTASLEMALLGLPQIVVYRVHRLTWFLMRPFVKLRYLSLVNLIAGREVAPELLQSRFTPGEVYKAAKHLLLDSQARQSVIDGSLEVRKLLGERGAADRAAEAVLEVYARTTASDP